MIAAYAGARLAVWFQTQRELEAERQSDARQVNTVLLHLIARLQWLEGLRNDAIEPQRRNPVRHLELLPILTKLPEPVPDLVVLNAILSAGNEGANLVLGLVSHEQQYAQLLSLIAKRNALHLHVQESLGSANIPNGANLSQDAIRHIIGAPVEKNLIDLTDSVIEGIDSCADEGRLLVDRLTSLARSHFRDIAILELKGPRSSSGAPKDQSQKCS